MFFFQRNWSLLLLLLLFYLLISRSSSFSVFHVNADINFSRKKDSALLLFFFSSKVRVTMRFTAEMRGVLERQIFTPTNKREGSAIKVY